MSGGDNIGPPLLGLRLQRQSSLRVWKKKTDGSGPAARFLPERQHDRWQIIGGPFPGASDRRIRGGRMGEALQMIGRSGASIEVYRLTRRRTGPLRLPCVNGRRS